MSYFKVLKGSKQIHEKNKAKRASSPSSKKKIRVNPGASFDTSLEKFRVRGTSYRRMGYDNLSKQSKDFYSSTKKFNDRQLKYKKKK